MTGSKILVVFLLLSASLAYSMTGKELDDVATTYYQENIEIFNQTRKLPDLIPEDDGKFLGFYLLEVKNTASTMRLRSEECRNRAMTIAFENPDSICAQTVSLTSIMYTSNNHAWHILRISMGVKMLLDVDRVSHPWQGIFQRSFAYGFYSILRDCHRQAHSRSSTDKKFNIKNFGWNHDKIPYIGEQPAIIDLKAIVTIADHQINICPDIPKSTLTECEKIKDYLSNHVDAYNSIPNLAIEEAYRHLLAIYHNDQARGNTGIPKVEVERISNELFNKGIRLGIAKSSNPKLSKSAEALVRELERAVGNKNSTWEDHRKLVEFYASHKQDKSQIYPPLRFLPESAALLSGAAYYQIIVKAKDSEQQKSAVYRAALAACDQALGLDSKCVPAMTVKGFSLAKIGRTEEGRTCIRRALEIDPNSSFAENYFSKISN